MMSEGTPLLTATALEFGAWYSSIKCHILCEPIKAIISCTLRSVLEAQAMVFKQTGEVDLRAHGHLRCGFSEREASVEVLLHKRVLQYSVN